MLPSRPTSRPKRRTLYVCLATVVSCLWLLHLCFGTEPDNGLSSDKKEYTGSAQQLPISHVPTEQELNVEAAGLEEATNEKKIPLEAHIMSKCPDAKDCLRDLIVPAMERIVDKVNFRLSFIGEIDSSDSSVHCRHGQTECLGNILSLCAQDLYDNSTKISLGFSTCMISSYADIPSRQLVQNCALEHGVDFELLNQCVSEEGKGMDLLEESVQRTKDAGVVFSCTVRLDDKIRCIMDGGEWKDCEGGNRPEDLIRDVEKLWAEDRE
ncbi:hypothetical protein MMC09_006789 [Bachmanniomyces sp. S44760]|nr:hypothetical protein [Bachmanniomyces sp. S44760]